MTVGTSFSAMSGRARKLDEWFAAFNRETDATAAKALRERRAVHWWDVLLRPAGIFLRLYLLKGGFREGAAGFIAAGLGAFTEFTTYAKMWEQLREP